MSESNTIIGTGNEPGTLKCFLHGFETFDLNEWNDHCEQTEHTDSGQTHCIDCDTTIEFENIPYQRITPAGKLIELRCPECFTKYSAQKLKIKRIDPLPEEGEEGSGTIQPPLEFDIPKATNTEQQLRENPKPNLRGVKII